MVDFDFTDFNLLELGISYEENFITIDVGFLTKYIQSLGVEDSVLTDYNSLKKYLQLLVHDGILVNSNWNFYLKEDIS